MSLPIKDQIFFYHSVGKANKWDQVINTENARKLGKGENRQNVVTPLWQNVFTPPWQKSIGIWEYRNLLMVFFYNYFITQN